MIVVKIVAVGFALFGLLVASVIAYGIWSYNRRDAARNDPFWRGWWK